MKTKISSLILSGLLLGVSTTGLAQNTPGYNNKIPEIIMMPDTVETRIGTLKFFDGMPDAATVQKTYDNLDFIRGVEVFLNFIPATSIEGMRLGMAEVGATESNQCVIFDKLMDSDPLFLTGNTDTVYASVMLDLKRDGVTVIEIPPKTEAVAVGNATARAIWLKPRYKSAYFYENSAWYTGFVGGDYRWLIDDGKGGRSLDARTLFFYSATVNTPAMAEKMVGVGSQYAFNATDKDGNYLDGSKTYKLNIPKDAPVKDFWSVVVYDPQTRSELQTSQKFPSKNNKRDKLIVNRDGSVDLYFGSKAPRQGKQLG